MARLAWQLASWSSHDDDDDAQVVPLKAKPLVQGQLYPVAGAGRSMHAAPGSPRSPQWFGWQPFWSTHVGNGSPVETKPALQAHDQWSVSATNAFFVCDMTSRVRERQPKLWIHGHSHDRCDYLLGKTRVVANPLGYPNEVRSLEAFEPSFQVEV
jgi:hypothetical protein